MSKALLKHARDALKAAESELLGVLDSINKDQIPHDGDDFHEALRYSYKAMSGLQAAIDAPEPEPDAYLVYDKGASSQYACLDDDLGDMDDCEVRPLYSHPPASHEPLTDEQIDAVLISVTQNRPFGWREFARALESAHGIK